MVVLIVDSERDTDRVARYLSGGFVDGVIIVSARANDPITGSSSGSSCRRPTSGTRRVRRTPASFVVIDNRGAARAITERLSATGRRRIGMIAAALDRDSGADRLAGFRDALGERFDETLVEPVPLYSYRRGATACRRSSNAPDLDGVFAASDAVAAGAIEALAPRPPARPRRRRHRRVRRQRLGNGAPPRRSPRCASPRPGSAARRPHSCSTGSAARPTHRVLLDSEIVWRDSA